MPRNTTFRIAQRGSWLECIVAALVVLVGAASSSYGARVPAHVSRADESALTFRVDLEPYAVNPGHVEGTVAVSVPGFYRAGAPGEPATLSRQFLVALPPSGSYSVTWRVATSTPMGQQRLEPNAFPGVVRDDDLGDLPTERYELDPTVYGAYRNPPTVVAADPVYIRRQRALPILVHPMTYDPATGQLVLATSIEVSVTFRPGVRSGAPVPAESPMWDGVFARLFVNPRQAAVWRTAPRVERSALAAERALPAVQGTRVKLAVRDTGVHKLTAQNAIAAGFPAGQSLSNLHMFRRTYNETTLLAGMRDVSFTVEEGASGTPGVFDGDDIVVFYARRLRDDPDSGDDIEYYSDHNVYWLESTSGPTMSTASPAPGFVTADTAAVSFEATGHFEIDAWFREPTRPGNQDFYYQNYGTEAGPVSLPLEIGAIRPGTTLDIDAALQGDRYNAPRLIRLRFISPVRDEVLNGGLSVPNKNNVLFQGSVPADYVVPGTNTFRIERPDGSRASVEVLINWVEVTYQSLLRARGNTLRFNTATLSGDTSVTVTGLSDTDVRLFDISDPDAPIRVATTAAHFFPAGNEWALSFRDNISQQKDYVVVPVDGMIEVGAGDVTLDKPSTIIGGSAEGGVDVLVVSHGDFIARMQEWATLRRAQGYRVLLVDVEDVYDEFNNGVPNALAIDRFVRHFFDLGGASALVLVGDASEDAKRVHPDSGPNFVPTHAFPDHVSVLNEDEVVTSDRRYVKLPGPGGTVDVFPDLIVGRIPVGSDAEMQRVLAKIFAFERPTASDFWRKRMIIISDDAHSEGASVFGGFQFCFQSNETPFEGGQERTARVIERSLPAGYDVVRFFLNDYSDPIHQTNCVSKTTAISFVREQVNPLLMDELNEGATLVTIQAHMNRSLVCHEKLLSTESAAAMGSTFGKDHLRLVNRGRFFIIFGMGCHFSDYALHRELLPGRVITNAPNGDAFAEQLVLANNSGAVASYGSSGFEYLGQTNQYMDVTSQTWFYEAPFDTMINQTQGQWVFGELMFLVENQLAIVQSGPVERYHILGDPLLNIDAGPPAFDATVNGVPFESGQVVGAGGEGDTIRVDIVVTDENVIRDFELSIDGVDRGGELQRTRLVDPQLPFSRQYELSFAHKLVPSTYDIVVRALQAPDTTAGQYLVAAEFVIRVESSVTLSVNGREVQTGDVVPAKGDYRAEFKLPVVIPEDSLAAFVDGAPVTDKVVSHPTPQDSTTWIVRFSRTLSPGPHEIIVQAGVNNRFIYNLTVGSDVGLRYVFNYPNPFKDTTSFLYTNDVELSDGSIDIYTVSGRRVRRIEIPPDARQPGSNSVFWDGRDAAGGELANGVYLYVIKVTQRGSATTTRGKLSRIK